MKKRVSGRRRTRGGAPPITTPEQIVANQKYKIYDPSPKTDWESINWEFRLTEDQMAQFKKSIVDPRIVSWMNSFYFLTGFGVSKKIDVAKEITDAFDIKKTNDANFAQSIREYQTRSMNSIPFIAELEKKMKARTLGEKRQIKVCVVTLNTTKVHFVDINTDEGFSMIRSVGRAILIYNDNKFIKCTFHKNYGDPGAVYIDGWFEKRNVSIKLSMMSQGINTLRRGIDWLRGAPKQSTLSTETAPPAGGKSRRKKRVNRKNHTKKIHR